MAQEQQQQQQQQGGELNAASSSRSNSSDSNRSRQHATLQRQQPLLHAHPGRYPPMDAHACFDLVLAWVIRPIGKAHLETCAPMVSHLFDFVWPFPWTTVHGDRHEHPGRYPPWMHMLGMSTLGDPPPLDANMGNV